MKLLQKKNIQYFHQKKASHDFFDYKKIPFCTYRKKKLKKTNQVLQKIISLFLWAFKSKLHFQGIYEATAWHKYS